MNSFTDFISPVVVKWLIHMKSLVVAAPALLIVHVSIIDCTITQIQMAMKQCGKLQRYNSIYEAIYMYLALYLSE